MDEDKIKKALSGLLKEAKEKRTLDDETRKAKNEEDRRSIFESVGKDIGTVIGPYIDALNARDEASHSAMGDALKRIITESIKIDAPNVDTTGIQEVLSGAFAALKIPPSVINYTPPAVNVPPLEMPEEMNIRGEVTIAGVSKKAPFPVMLMGPDGKPMTFSQAVGMSGGGNFPMRVLDESQNALRVTGNLTVTGSNNSTQIIDSSSNPVNAANPLPVTVVAGASSSTKAQIGNSDGDFSATNPLPVTFAAAASQNVNVFDGQASTVTSHQDTTGDYRGLDVTSLRTINVESALNSSVVALGSGGVFTGLAEDVKDFSTIQVAVFADQISATDGLSIQQSKDGSNWDITDVYTIPASNGKTFSVQVAARYFRLVYTNGGTIQGAFRMGSYLHQNSPKMSSQRPSDGLSNENDFEQVSAYMAMFNGLTWDRVHSGGFDSLGAIRTSQATDSVSSVSVSGFVTTVGAALVDSSGVAYSGSNPLIVDANDSLGQGDSISAIRTIQAGDSVSSVYVNNPVAQGDSATALRIVHAGDVSVSTSIRDFNGNAPATGSNETNAGVLRTVLMTDSVSSVNVTQFNGNAPATGLNETTAGVLRTVTMSDTVSSSQSKILSMTTLPTAVGDATSTFQKSDKLGRALSRPVQVRELIATAYVTLSNGTETTLATAGAGNFLDLIYIMGANTSGVAQQIDIRAVSGGNIVMSLYIPANSTAGVTLSVPFPQDATGNSWTVDMADVTNSNILISALFTKEI